jgi:DNA polymerase sigma
MIEPRNILSIILLSRLSPYIDEIIGDHLCGFNITDQLLIGFSPFVRYWRKKWEYSETVHQVFIDFKKAYD